MVSGSSRCRARTKPNGTAYANDRPFPDSCFCWIDRLWRFQVVGQAQIFHAWRRSVADSVKGSDSQS